MDDAGITSAFDRIADEWDKAEKLIKTAEVTRNEVVIASVNELRYAGRRLVDALRAADACRADPTCKKSEEDLKRYVSETLSFCQRALHDAVDAIILHVRTQIGEYETEFGYIILVEKFPELIEIKKVLKQAENIVILSREDRMKRGAEYEELATTSIPVLLGHCNGLEANRELLVALAKEKRAARNKERWVEYKFWIGIVLGLVVAIVGGVVVTQYKAHVDRQAAKAAAEQVTNPPAQAALPKK